VPGAAAAEDAFHDLRQPLRLDGEPIADTRFRFEALPRWLRMKLPPACPLLAGDPEDG
jgi:diacylglycerol kinase family enzyme